MQAVWDYLLQNPLVLAAIILSEAIWIASIIIVIVSRKFLRKWLWVLLSIFSISYKWSIASGVFLGVGFPAGSLYILWHWIFGRSPTQERIAAVAARRSKNAGSSYAFLSLRVAYFVGTLAVTLLGALIISGLAIESLIHEAQSKMHGAHQAIIIPEEFRYGVDVFAVGLALLMLFLTYRPYWWGKILCVWAGLSWIGYGLITLATLDSQSIVAITILMCGVTMIAVAVVHQIIDPRFGGSYFRLRRE